MVSITARGIPARQVIALRAERTNWHLTYDRFNDPRLYFIFSQAGVFDDRVAPEQPLPFGPLDIRSCFTEKRERQTGSQRQGSGEQ